MMETLRILDTTLRDGEQSPGATMNQGEKIRLARQLEFLGVDIVEAGFPAASQGDFQAVRMIAGTLEKAEVAALCRALPTDIACAWDAVSCAHCARLHTFVATSDVHLEHKLRKSRSEVLAMVREAVGFATSKTTNVEFSAEDASRSDPEFLRQVLACAIESGARIVNIPDTVGYAQPEEFGALISWLRAVLPQAGEVVFSVHCHNDLGLACANSLAAVRAGARQVETTLSGIGERAGNAALEEIAMALQLRQEYYGVRTHIRTEQLYPSARLLSLILGQPIPANKAITGANAFAHQSGIHQHGMLKHRGTYEIMTPESVGRSQGDMVLGKHSGRAAFGRCLEELGYRLTSEQLSTVCAAMKKLADRKKEIFVEDLEAVVLDEVFRLPDVYRLEYVSVVSGNMAIPNAVLKVYVHGKERLLTACGTGPVDAIFNGLGQLLGCRPRLVRFAVNSITGGTDAQGEVTVKIEAGGRMAVGRGSEADILVASARAYVNALNRLVKSAEECPKMPSGKDGEV